MDGNQGAAGGQGAPAGDQGGRAAWVLFTSPACPVCAEAEALVDAAQSIKFRAEKKRVLPSARPGFIVIDPGAVEAPAEVVPATPALWDVQANVLYMGLEAIEGALAAL